MINQTKPSVIDRIVRTKVLDRLHPLPIPFGYDKPSVERMSELESRSYPCSNVCPNSGSNRDNRCRFTARAKIPYSEGKSANQTATSLTARLGPSRPSSHSPATLVPVLKRKRSKRNERLVIPTVFPRRKRGSSMTRVGDTAR